LQIHVFAENVLPEGMPSLSCFYPSDDIAKSRHVPYAEPQFAPYAT
jgi:hypothetical protein